MTSREASLVGASDLSSSDRAPSDLRRVPPRQHSEVTADSSSSQSNSQNSGNALRHPLESRPPAVLSTSVTNDSFGHPLGNNTVFASTRPFNNHQSPNDVERFLLEPPVTNQTFVPSMVQSAGGDSLHLSQNSSFVSIPKPGTASANVSTDTSPRTTNTVPPIVVQPHRQASLSSFPATPLTTTVHHDPKSSVSFLSSMTSSVGSSQQPDAALTHTGSGDGTITATQSSPLVVTTKPPMPTIIKSTSYSSKPATFSNMRSTTVTEKSPSVLVATASSSSPSGITNQASSAAPRSPSRRTLNTVFPAATPASVPTAGSTTTAASPRPASPGANLARTGSNHSLNSRGSESASLAQVSDGGVAALANYSPLVRNSLSPNSSPAPPTPSRNSGYTTAPPAFAGTAALTQREPGMHHTRSEGELRHLFSDRGGYAGSSTAFLPAAAGTGQQSPSWQGGPSLSVGSRQRGVVRATESSSALGGMHNSSRYTPSANSGGSGGSGSAFQPRWLSAVERMKSNRLHEDLSLYDPILPYDQSRLGLQARQAGQQGMLTASKLRALEAQHAGAAKGGERGGLQPLVAYSVAGGRANSPMSRTGTMSPTRMPILTAKEEAFQSTARYNRGTSEQGRRSGYIRSTTGNGVGSVSAYGGGHHSVTAVPGAVRSSAGGGGGVITASEMVTNGSNFSGSNGTFLSRSEQGGITGSTLGGLSQKLGTAEHKLASLFQLRPPGSGGGLHAKETSTGEVVTAFFGSANASANGNSVLRATQEQKAVTPRNAASRSNSGAAVSGGDGGSGSGSNRNSGKGRRVLPKRGDEGKAAPTESQEVKKQINTEGDEDERDERNFRTHNINALHAIPWDQRRQLPMTGFGTRFFALLSTPRFWEKLDWAVRGSILTVLPTMVLALEPATTGKFPMASSLAFNAFWITMPTFGSGLRELIIALKGFSFGLIFLIIVVATQPGPNWLLLLLLFVFTLFSSFVAEETKKTTAYVLASTIMQYLTDHKGTNFAYVGQYYEGLLIALAFGTAAFIVPFIRWSSDITRHYIKAMANSLSIDLQGTLSSFWVRTPLERELNVMRLRQLRATAEKCIGKIETALDESGYEPHTGAYMMCMTNRFNFCKSIHNILGSLSHVIELIADNPSSVDTPMCRAFGEQIGEDLAVISSAMDSMVLKICDFERIVTPQEIQFFREARERFQEAVSRVRENVILTNENYETDESDILLGFFMFSVDEMCEVISQFEETANPPNVLISALLFPIRDVKSVIFAFKNLALTIVRRRTIPRRLKEAIKLAVCMVLPCIFQVYALGNNAVSPMAGASVIALIYNPTGAESFHYASGRLLGTVLGSMASLLSVQIADGRRWVLYLFIILLSFIGAYVQAAPGFYALGNAIVCSTISVCTQYKNQDAAMVRIQQNCFAILMYFAVVCILWPMRARDKVKMSLDFSLRCTRESITRMLRNLDMPYDPNEVNADVSALLMEMNKKVRTQVRFIPGAVEEPTLGSVAYPEDAWKRIVEAERKLWLVLSMMRFAYHTFMSSRADSTTELSVHWVVLHRISPHARDLSDLIYSAIDLYLLSLNNTTVVPTSHLTRLRVGMVEAHKAIEDTYIRTISRKVAGEDSDDEEGEEEEARNNGSFRSSYAEDDYYDPSDFGDYQPLSTTANSRNLSGAQQGADNNISSSNSNGRGCGGDGKSSTNRKGEESVSGVQKDPTGDDDEKKAEKSKSSNNNNNNVLTAEQKKDDGARRKKATHRRESSRSSSSSSAAGSHNGDRNNEDDPQKKGKKKMGYLGYDLTKDEAAALRAFVASRVVNNNTFGMNKSMVGNMTFIGRRSMSGAVSAAAAAALNGGGAGASRASMAGSPPQVNNDAKLMAMRGGDDDLAAELRKKHNVTVKKDKEEDHADKNANDEDDNKVSNKTFAGKSKAGCVDPHVENLTSLNLTNASFFKNHSFLRNTSFLGNLFSKKPKETHDLDAEMMHDSDVSSSTCAVSKSGGKKSKRGEGAAEQKPRRTSSAMGRKERREKKAEDDTVSERSTPSTSPTRSHCGLRSDRQTAASEFSDIEDDPRPNRKSGAQGKDSAGVAKNKGKDGKGGGRPPMARSMPTVLPVKGGEGAVANPLGDSGGENAGGKPVRMASSTPAAFPARTPTGAFGESAKPGSALPDDGMGSAPKSVPQLLGLGAGSSATVATFGAHSADEGHTPFGVTPLEGKRGSGGGAASAAAAAPSQDPPPAETMEPTAKEDGGAAPHRLSGNEDTPEDGNKAGKVDSRDSSNHTGSTEKKILTADAESGATPGSSEGKDEKRGGDGGSDGHAKAPTYPGKTGKSTTDGGNTKEGKSPQRVRGANDVTSQAGVSYASHGMNSMRYLSPRSASRAADQRSNYSADRTAELLESMQDGELDSTRHFNEGEMLNNISFFDPEKGEFVLTNHDIHSLEAFLFGTQALVRYINELQKAILEMQHETELAKLL